MNRFFKYLTVQFKRSAKLFPHILCFTLILSGCLLLFLGAMVESEDASDKNIRVRVGLVGNIEETHMGIGISVVTEFDSSRNYVEFLPLEAEEADRLLSEGKIIGYVEIPDGFVDAIIDGTNVHLTYVEGNNPSAMGPMLTREIVDIISAIVIQSQCGVFGMADLAEGQSVEYSYIHDGMEELNLRYFDAIFSREDMYELNIMGQGKGLGFAHYYSVAFVLILIILWGIISVPLFGTRDISLPRLLSSQGTGSIAQSIGEYIPFFILIFINTGLLWVTAGFVIDSPLFSLGMLVYLIPCVMLITSMQFFLYELSSNIITAVLVQLLCGLGLAYISGFIYPVSSLPSTVAALGGIMPTGVCFDYLAGLFIDDPDFVQILPLIVYSLLFICGSALVRRVKIRRVNV